MAKLTGLGRVAVVGAVVATSAVAGTFLSGVAQASTCKPDVGHTGLTAAVVATSSQTISGRTIDATGCDIGIYVGAGVTNVTVSHATVSGANFQGLFAEKTSHLTVEGSVFHDNGFHTIDPSAPALPGNGLHSKVGQSFAISLFGVSDSTVTGNQVYNNGRGSIGIMDNGPNDPGSITQDRHAPLVASTNDVITHNRIWRSYGGCGIVVATQNVHGSLSHLTIANNTIVGKGLSHVHGPDIGGLVVAADLPGSSVTYVSVHDNTITGSFEGGVIVNAEAPGSFTQHVTVDGNTVRGNNWGKAEAPSTAGIIVFAGAPGASNQQVVVSNNTASGQYFGIWTYQSPSVTLTHNTFQAGTTVNIAHPGCVADQTPFPDVSATNVHCGNIAWLKTQKITKPSDGKYHPASSVTRGAMTAFLFRLTHSGQASPVCTSKPFPDVTTDSEFCGYIQWAATHHIAFGYSDGHFGAGNAVTRGAMAAFLHRIATHQAAPACTSKPFTDVPVSSPFCGVITWMKDHHITYGIGGGQYGTDRPVTRQAMASFLHRISDFMKA